MNKKSKPSLKNLVQQVKECQACIEHLPLGPRPVIQVGARAKVVIIGQAPGTKVHESGIPWDDPSGDHLREWLAIDKDTFYDRQKIAILPMGFCYPGKKKGGDAPPRPECAPLWHNPLLENLAKNRIILLVGQYAQKYYLGNRIQKTLTETVRAYASYLPEFFVLPHPSWRSKIWMEKNKWFGAQVLPALKKEIKNR